MIGIVVVIVLTWLVLRYVVHEPISVLDVLRRREEEV